MLLILFFFRLQTDTLNELLQPSYRNIELFIVSVSHFSALEDKVILSDRDLDQ